MTTDIAALDLAKLKELAEKATPGPWEHVNRDNGEPVVIDGESLTQVCDAYDNTQWSDEQCAANAAFIAAAREAVPALIAEIESLKANHRRDDNHAGAVVRQRDATITRLRALLGEALEMLGQIDPDWNRITAIKIETGL